MFKTKHLKCMLYRTLVFFQTIFYFCKQAAEQMVKFQLRHGNDLLAMDSLRDCDVRNCERIQISFKKSLFKA